MSVDFKVVGNRIKSLRKQKDLTQEGLAKKMSLSVAYLSRVERGISHISLKRLTEIAEILGVPISYLLSGSIETSNDYLVQDFNNVFQRCTPEKQRVILEMAKLVSTM